MKKHYTLFLFMLLATLHLSAQRIVNIPPSSDPTMPTDIFPVIMGDTTAAGDRIDENTIYKLQNGQVYITTGRIVNKPNWPLQIEATDLSDTENKAIISRIPNASGSYPDVMRPEGDVTLRNLWIISGENGALEQHDWGRIRFMGDNIRVVADHCIIEKDRGGFFQLRGNGIKLFITNSILRNGGNRRILQGNGRGVDARNTNLDTLVMRNTIVHNLQDRFFRSQGATAPHNYVEIDHCTAFNVAGRHGFIQLGRVLEAKITNNLFINPIMLGSSPIYTDEQTQPDNDLHKVITVDTVYDNTTFTVSNNNAFWTDDVKNYWASNDSVSAPGLMSTLIVDKLGAAASDAFFEEEVTLNSIPGTILQYVIDVYNDPTADDMYDFIVEDASLAGTPFDSGNLFDFSTFDPCYSKSTQSATGDTDGGPVGAADFCPNLVSVFDVELNEALALKVFPNPIATNLNFTFELQKSSQVNITVNDMSGKLITTILDGQLQSGLHTFNEDISGQLSGGMYFLSLQTEQGVMTKKFVVYGH